jgi:hypothetical protein
VSSGRQARQGILCLIRRTEIHRNRSIKHLYFIVLPTFYQLLLSVSRSMFVVSFVCSLYLSYVSLYLLYSCFSISGVFFFLLLLVLT